MFQLFGIYCRVSASKIRVPSLGSPGLIRMQGSGFRVRV